MSGNFSLMYTLKLGVRFAALNIIDDDINNLTSNFNEVRETAEEVLGRQRHQAWITNDILDLCNKRKQSTLTLRKLITIAKPTIL